MIPNWQNEPPAFAALRRRIVAWLAVAGHGTSREMAHYFKLKPDTISGRCNELEAAGELERDGKRGCGPGRPCIVWRIKH